MFSNNIYMFLHVNHLYVLAWIEWQCCLSLCVCVWERKWERETDRLPAYHTPIHKSILSELHDMPVIPRLLTSPLFSPLVLSLSPSLHEANPIHCNIIRASPCYLDSLPEPKRHTQGQIDFPVALDLWQSSRNHIAQPPTSPSSSSTSHKHTHIYKQTLIHTPPPSQCFWSNSEHPQNVFFSPSMRHWGRGKQTFVSHPDGCEA